MRALSILFVLLATVSTQAFDDVYEGYEDIVDRLTADTDNYYNRSRIDFRKLTRAHAGIGMSQTFYQSSSSDGDRNGLRHGGLMLALGVDLLSRSWTIEGIYHNFGRSEGQSTRFQLKEVALKLLYKPHFINSWFLRFGGGMSSRFLKVTNFETATGRNYQTPSLLANIGMDTFITDAISFGIDFNFKSALIEDTIDRRSVDVSLRLDTHF